MGPKGPKKACIVYGVTFFESLYKNIDKMYYKLYIDYDYNKTRV